MTGKEYSDALELLGLTVKRAAAFLRINERMSRRVAAGDDVLGWPRAALLRLMVLHRVKPEQVDKMMSDYKEPEKCENNEAE